MNNQDLDVKLGNRVFLMNKEAKDKLDRYLENLEKKFSGQSDSSEIVEDVETRIAELLLKHRKNNKKVDELSVDKVLKRIGSVEDFDTDYMETRGSSSNKSKKGINSVWKIVGIVGGVLLIIFFLSSLIFGFSSVLIFNNAVKMVVSVPEKVVESFTEGFVEDVEEQRESFNEEAEESKENYEEQSDQMYDDFQEKQDQSYDDFKENRDEMKEDYENDTKEMREDYENNTEQTQ